MFSLFKKSTDPYEEMLNGLMRRVLHGEDISMFDFLDTLDDLSEEPEESPSEQEIQAAAEGRKRFREELARFGLPIENRHLLCQQLCARASEQPSPELLRLICYLFCDTGTLLDLDPEAHSPEQDALCWRRIRKEAEELYARLSSQKQMSVRLREVLKRTKTASAAGIASGDSRTGKQILAAYVRAFPSKGDQETLQYNISALLQLMDSSPDLTTIAPLFLYRALTRHKKRLQSKLDLRIDFSALWKYKTYKIDGDNGKNYQTYEKYVSLFESLYHIFAVKDGVDAPLCLYGFDHLSNLGDFYRMYPQERQTLPFALSIEDLLLEMECSFSIYEHGMEDNVLLGDSGLSATKLDRFQYTKDRNIQNALARIETYINRNLQDIMGRFLNAAPEQVRELCAEILENADLRDEQRPKKQKERALFLAAINKALMEAADDSAETYLVDACKLLVGDRVEEGRDCT